MHSVHMIPLWFVTRAGNFMLHVSMPTGNVALMIISPDIVLWLNDLVSKEHYRYTDCFQPGARSMPSESQLCNVENMQPLTVTMLHVRKLCGSL